MKKQKFSSKFTVSHLPENSNKLRKKKCERTQKRASGEEHGCAEKDKKRTDSKKKKRRGEERSDGFVPMLACFQGTPHRETYINNNNNSISHYFLFVIVFVVRSPFAMRGGELIVILAIFSSVWECVSR